MSCPPRCLLRSSPVARGQTPWDRPRLASPSVRGWRRPTLHHQLPPQNQPHNRGQKIHLRIPGLCMLVIYVYVCIFNLLYMFPRNIPTELNCAAFSEISNITFWEGFLFLSDIMKLWPNMYSSHYILYLVQEHDYQEPGAGTDEVPRCHSPKCLATAHEPTQLRCHSSGAHTAAVPQLMSPHSCGATAHDHTQLWCHSSGAHAAVVPQLMTPRSCGTTAHDSMQLWCHSSGAHADSLAQKNKRASFPRFPKILQKYWLWFFFVEQIMWCPYVFEHWSRLLTNINGSTHSCRKPD